MSYRNKGTIGPTTIVSKYPDSSGNWVCNGVADDVEIQAAIDYASPGGIVFIRGGDYYISQTIDLTARGPIIITGAGEGDGTNEQTRLLFAPTNSDCLSANDVGSHLHLQIKNLRLRGPNSGTGNGIYLRYCRMAIIENVQCERFGDSGIKFSNTMQSKILNCRMSSNLSAGITLERNATDGLRSNNNYIEGGACVNNTTYGVYIYRSQGNYVDLDLEGSVNGVYLDGEGTYWNEIRGWIENNTTGINIPNATVAFTKVRRRVLSGNVTNIVDAGDRTDLPQVFSPVVDPDSNVGDHPALVLPDTVDTPFRFQIQVPNDFQETVTADVIVVQLSTGGPPNMQWSTTTDWGELCAEAYNAGSDAETDQTTAVTQNVLTCIDVSGSLTGISSSDLVGFTFIRRASQGGDTINADAYYLGFRMRYV